MGRDSGRMSASDIDRFYEGKMGATIDRNLPITVTMTLPAGHWDAVLQVLGNAPHNVVRQLIDQIQAQCMRHAMPAPPQWQQTAQQSTLAARANGGSPAGS